MSIIQCEPTIEELLSDPLRETVLQHARKTPDDIRAMLREARDRVANTNGTGEPKVLPNVELKYIPPSFIEEAKVRLLIFRKHGSAILEIECSAIAAINQPASEKREDILQAFRKCVPLNLRALNKMIAATPPGGVVKVTTKMLRQNT